MNTKRSVQLALSIIFALPILLCCVIPAQAGTTGVVSGAVTDSATGQKLVGVNVIIEDTNLTTITDKNGEYIITNVAPGTYKVTASLVGYADAVSEKVSVVMDVTAKLDFSMVQSVAEEETSTVVKAVRPVSVQAAPTPTMYIVDSNTEQMVKSQPSMLYQAPGIISTQPGVVEEPGGTPHIRGGRQDEIGWTIDGIPVFDPISNGFGTNLVTIGMNKMEIYTGGYRPEYGNAISGVLNEVIKTGKTAPGFTLQMLGGGQGFDGLYPEIGGTLAKGGDYYVGSYLWQSDLKDSQANRVISEDTVGKFNIPLNKNDGLTFLAVQGSEKYLMPSSHTQTYANGSLETVPSTTDQEHQGYLLSALTYSHNIGSKSFFTVKPYYFRTSMKMDTLGVNDGYGQFTDSKSETLGFQSDYTNHTSSKHLLKAGFIQMNSKNRYSAIVPYLKDYYNPVTDPETGDFLYNLGDYAYTANADSAQTGVYVQDQFAATRALSIDMGLRYDRILYKKVAHDNTSDSQVSPRLGLSYTATAKDKFKTSWGRMIQFPYTQIVERQYTDPNWGNVRGFDNSNISSEKSTQMDIGWERSLGEDYSLQLTPFYRKYDNLIQTKLVNAADPYGPSIFENLGEGTSRGLELLLSKKMSRDWSGWLSYTYMKAKAQSSSDRESVTPGSEYYVNWDQRHTISLVLSYVRNSWTYALKGEYGSGFPYGANNSLRIPSHTVFDLNISKAIKGGLLPEGQMNLTIANIFNVHNVLSGQMVTDYDAEYAPIGEHFEPTAFVLPRFISLSYARHY